MRIIAGKLRGRKIPELKNVSLRPTTDFAKEGIFNVLHNKLDWQKTNAMDLFSGTGSIAFEMVSRGAKHVTAVDNNKEAVSFINTLAEDFKLSTELISIIQQNVFHFLEKPAEINYDLIFADPPFDTEPEDYLKIITLIQENGWLSPKGIIVIEHSIKKDFSNTPSFVESRKYGSVQFSIFS